MEEKFENKTDYKQKHLIVKAKTQIYDEYIKNIKDKLISLQKQKNIKIKAPQIKQIKDKTPYILPSIQRKKLIKQITQEQRQINDQDHNNQSLFCKKSQRQLYRNHNSFICRRKLPLKLEKCKSRVNSKQSIKIPLNLSVQNINKEKTRKNVKLEKKIKEKITFNTPWINKQNNPYLHDYLQQIFPHNYII